MREETLAERNKKSNCMKKNFQLNKGNRFNKYQLL